VELALEPLRVEHALEMAGVLGEPEAVLRARYERQVAGRSRGWRNWVVRLDGVAAGYVQATVSGRSAELAWVVGEGFRGRGIASEAAGLALGLLRDDGVERFFAHIDPANAASEGVARRVGMVSTGVARDDGEVRWELAG